MNLLSTALPMGRRLVASALKGVLGAAAAIGLGLLALGLLVRYQGLSVSQAMNLVGGVWTLGSAAVLVWMAWKDPAGVHDENRFGRFFGAALTFFLSSFTSVAMLLEQLGVDGTSFRVLTGLYQLACVWVLFLMMEVCLKREGRQSKQKKKAASAN